MEQLNRIELKGVVGRISIDEYGDTQAARISMATNYGYRDKDGTPVIETTWHAVNVTAAKGSETSETLKRVGKGSLLRVVGRLRAVRYTTPEGQDIVRYEVVANKIELI